MAFERNRKYRINKWLYLRLFDITQCSSLEGKDNNDDAFQCHGNDGPNGVVTHEVDKEKHNQDRRKT